MAKNNRGLKKKGPAKPTQKLEDKAVLAQAFVPNRIKHVNAIAPNHVIGLDPIPSLNESIWKLRRQLEPLPACCCTGAKHDVSVSIVTIEPETEFALAVPKELIESTSVKSVDAVTNLKDYTEVLYALIKAEREEILRLYERYSLYQLPVQSSSASAHAYVVAPGLTDAKPPIQAGDLVLFRPMRSISLRVPSGFQGHDDANGRQVLRAAREWTAPMFAVQIKAQVVQLKHGTAKNRSSKSEPSRDDVNNNNNKAKTNQRKSNDRTTLVTTWLSEELKQDIMLSYPEQTFNVRIIPSTRAYERCLTALEWVSRLPHALSNQLLFPSEAPTVEHQDNETDIGNLENLKDLNAKQLAFVRLVRARTLSPSHAVVRPPMILTGPAGTGKSKTMLASIFHILEDINKEHRILVCTPSHTAADVVTRRLAKKLSKNELWRLVDSQRPIAAVPGEVLKYCRQDVETGTFSLPSSVEELYQLRVIVCTCSDAHILYKLGFTNEQLRQRRECFANFCKDAHSRLNLGGNSVAMVDDVSCHRPHFSHLFVDEAAQATEPEILIPLSVVLDPAASVMVEIGLVGDPRQLAPNIYSKAASDGGLGRSYMERILQRPFHYFSGGWPHMLGSSDDDNDYNFLNQAQMKTQRSSVFLTANYRGHVSFLMMPSCLFYFDKLTTVETHNSSNTKWALRLRCIEALEEPVTNLALQWGEHVQAHGPQIVWPSSVVWNFMDIIRFRRQSAWPLHFRGVQGKDTHVSIEAFAGSSSWSNRPEAEAVVKIVVTLISDGVSSASIGVMAPFRGQVVLIRSMLREKHLAGVDVGTIEDYQAVERDVIVLSLTRSSKSFLANDIASRAGLFHQVKRSNVALTRAEHLFIVVGDPSLMVQDPIWKQWLWFCLRNGLWYGKPIDAEMIKMMQSKPLTIATFREGEYHALLGSIEVDNTMVMSTLERETRGKSL